MREKIFRGDNLLKKAHSKICKIFQPMSHLECTFIVILLTDLERIPLYYLYWCARECRVSQLTQY